jgi:predicted O-methyltransferase YrrM
MTTLQSPTVRTVLDRLFAAASHDDDGVEFPAGATAQEAADALAELYMPVSAAGGELLYSLVRSARPATVVEFGTSYGISTLYLAAAVADNGVGHVFTTELSAVKVEAAQSTVDESGLGDHVTILAGDALETLASVPGPIGIVLLDGWKQLCLPVLRLLEPKLAPGALVLADDTDLPDLADYLAFVRDPANGYVSVHFPVADGMEVSCRA